jgi:hypothetical protein
MHRIYLMRRHQHQHFPLTEILYMYIHSLTLTSKLGLQQQSLASEELLCDVG